MTGGFCKERQSGELQQVTIGAPRYNNTPTGDLLEYYYRSNAPFKNKKLTEYEKLKNEYNWPNQDQNIVIKCNEYGKYYYEVNIQCDGDVKTYVHLPKNISKKNNTTTDLRYFFETYQEAEHMAKLPEIQVSLIKLALLNQCKRKIVSNS